ncbi:Bromodomain-containing protein [Baffinella frigidus]|nr:Bromodomain-containing protein [Cryptophyta sp. CCMP2293]
MCKTVLSKLIKHRDVNIFMEPVDHVTLNIPDYPRVITRPMDIGTVRKKLQGGEYTSNEQFAADVRLTFDNAMLFNQEGDFVWTCAKKISTLFEQVFHPRLDSTGAITPRPGWLQERRWITPRRALRGARPGFVPDASVQIWNILASVQI